ncbi:CPBP family glutamic-type intramembrane protease [uncultured Sphingomonas sp.]|uniref:CPBP family intramembrane glutamic endopeptidase n=1 Tax=uncultured Sphingomonas sp. TaxID=158754 RepID=UPI0025D9A2D1|nr:CPBP family glutamic-type intramembrane protease [uncultured Sphingomonas sp.]
MRARAIALAGAGVLATWACLWGVAPFADHLVRGASPIVAEAGFGAIVFGTILVLAWGLGRVAGVSWRWAGFSRGAAIGLGALLLAIGYCALAGTLTTGAGSTVSLALPLGALVILLQVVAEEAMFRGVVQPLLVRGVGAGAAVPLTAASFAALHGVLGGLEPVMLANMLLGGVLFGLLALTRGVGAAIGAHFAWNAFEQLGVGLDPNPGHGAFGAMIDLDLRGAPLWGGSVAGLNGSIAMGIAVVVAILFVLWRRPA